MPESEEFCKGVEAALARDLRLNLQRCPVRLTCTDGILTVEGEVEHIAAKSSSWSGRRPSQA
jgi:hypothetical protein